MRGTGIHLKVDIFNNKKSTKMIFYLRFDFSQRYRDNKL